MKKDNKTYVIDMDNLMNFIFDSVEDRTNDSEITETYVTDEESGELQLINKQLREIKGSESSSKHTIRYDMVKMFIDILINMEEVEGQITPVSFGEKLIVNTMINENLIKEINV